MSEVVMKDLNTVVIDGNPAGCLVDAVLNNRDAAGEIHDAFTAWTGQFEANLRAAEKGVAAEEAKIVAAHHAEEVEALQTQLRDMTIMKDGFRQAAENWQARYQEAAEANMRLDAKLKEQRAELVAALNMANQAVLGTSEQATAAARELSRLQALGNQAAAAAQLAEHDRLAQTPVS